MTKPAIPTATPRYPAPELKNLPEDIKAKVLEVQEKAGFVPNVFLALARRPAERRAFFAYHDALMLKEEGSNPTGSLTKGEREMIVTTTSAANHCLYCVVAHGAILRIYEKKPLVADQVAVNYRKADITPRQRAMLDFAMKVCLSSDEIEDSDFKALHAHGFDDEDAWEAFRRLPAVQAALDAVPDPVEGLLIYPGRGGSSGRVAPRSTRPTSGAGAAAMPIPPEDVFLRPGPDPRSTSADLASF